MDVIKKSRPKKPSNPHPSPCTRPVKWPKIRPVIKRQYLRAPAVKRQYNLGKKKKPNSNKKE